MTTPHAQRPHMPGYGVETPDWHPLPWSWAAGHLAGTRNYWVSTASAAGQPHSLPVWGVWHDRELTFMFSCAHGSRKARNLGSNPKIAFTNDDTVECVSVQGSAARVVEQHTVHFTEQAQAQGKAAAQALDTVGHGGHATADLMGVLQGHAGPFVDLEQHQVGQRRLCALDLR